MGFRGHSGTARTSRFNAGFTLVELIATMAVLAIVAGMAAPSLVDVIARNRAYSAQVEISAYLALARTEAARRNVPVVLSATTPVANNEYAGGWQLWADLNGNGILDPGEPIIRTHEPLTGRMVLRGPANISYAPTGFLVAMNLVRLVACSQDTDQQYTVTVQPNGLADVAVSTAIC